MEFELCGINLKSIQHELLDILLEFDRICNKHGLKYQLFAGTLLGAIRHEGFIPWDDDIDVCMLRSEYEKFIDICLKELSPKYFLQTYETDYNYYKQFAKIRKNGTVFLQELVSDLNIHHGIYIDIFPLDNVKPGTVSGILQQKILFLLGRLDYVRSKKRCKKTSNTIVKYSGLSMHYLVRTLPKKITDKLQYRIATMFSVKDTVYISHLTNGVTKVRYHKFIAEQSTYQNMLYKKFEGFSFPVPVNYDDVLTRLYGDYKRIPEREEQTSHHDVIKVILSSEGES